ncbi:MAG: LacI family DNA-binding transcriptional regulator [Thermoflexales bacterium]|nr:LacI family DNA-binding transcriptional regulator [Thermoflexales bacterium]
MSPSNRRSSANITILDVASQAGVSYGTVSRVINNSPHVKAATRERVQAVMQRLGYVVDRRARSLAGRSSRVIGVLLPDLGTGYIGEIMRGIDTELELNQYDMMIYTTHRREAKETNYITAMTQGVAEGLLLILPRNPGAYIEILRSRDFPFVLIDHQGTDEKCIAVGATNWQGGYIATEYLVRLGHRRIGLIAGSPDLGSANERLDGYKAALKTHHLPVDQSLIQPGDFAQPAGFQGAKALLSLSSPPTAIFASNDVMAFGAMEAVRDSGLSIPCDISIIGFDDIPQSLLVYPPLTTVRQPLEQMGRVATQILLAVLDDPQREYKRMELPTELVIRESCRSLNAPIRTGTPLGVGAPAGTGVERVPPASTLNLGTSQVNPGALNVG